MTAMWPGGSGHEIVELADGFVLVGAETMLRPLDFDIPLASLFPEPRLVRSCHFLHRFPALD